MSEVEQDALPRILHALAIDCENTDGWQGAAADCRAAADRIEALEAENARLQSAFSAGEARGLERAAEVAEAGWMPAYIQIDQAGDWHPGSPFDRGAVDACNRIAIAIRALSPTGGER